MRPTVGSKLREASVFNAKFFSQEGDFLVQTLPLRTPAEVHRGPGLREAVLRQRDDVQHPGFHPAGPASRQGDLTPVIPGRAHQRFSAAICEAQQE
jgi:hypothetical protein